MEIKMNIAVRYISRGGNTKRVANTIAGAVGEEALDCTMPIPEPVDLLFLGGAVYGFQLDESMIAFINSLDTNTVKAAAVFGTSAIVKSGIKKMTGILKAKGIRVIEPYFYCPGEFKMLHVGHPDAADLKRAAAFAESTRENYALS